MKLKDCNNLRESDILINEIDTLESILGRLSDLKYGAETRAIEVANANNDFKQSNRLRKKLIKFQDTEDEISAQYSNTKSRLTSENRDSLLFKHISASNCSSHKSTLTYRKLEHNSIISLHLIH